MQVLFPILAMVLGIVVALVSGIEPLSGTSGLYMAIACVAGLDSVTGGIRSGLEGKFSNDIFVTGFIANVVISYFIAWLGDQIGVNLYFVAILVMGTRVFTNLSLIRRQLVTLWRDYKDRAKAKEQTTQKA